MPVSFASFDAKSLKRLAEFQATVGVERSDCDFNLGIRKPELPDEAQAEIRRARFIAVSRAKYATPCAEVKRPCWRAFGAAN